MEYGSLRAVVRLVALLVLAAQLLIRSSTSSHAAGPLRKKSPATMAAAAQAQMHLALNLAPTPAEAAVQRATFDVVTASPAPLSDIEEGEEQAGDPSPPCPVSIDKCFAASTSTSTSTSTSASISTYSCAATSIGTPNLGVPTLWRGIVGEWCQRQQLLQRWGVWPVRLSETACFPVAGWVPPVQQHDALARSGTCARQSDVCGPSRRTVPDQRSCQLYAI